MRKITELLSDDHVRLDGLLAAALPEDGTIDEAPYLEFRRGLLRHIGIEERLLFPEVRKREGTTAAVEQLHRDHAALAALLVPRPDTASIRQIRAILDEHNPLEEGPHGLYQHVEMLVGDDLETLMAALEAFPETRVAAYSDTPILRNSIEQLLRERKKR